MIKKNSLIFLLKKSFAQYAPHSGLFLKCMLLEILASIFAVIAPLVCLAFLRHQITNFHFLLTATILGIFIFILLQAIMAYVSAGFTHMALKLYENKNIFFKDFFVSWNGFKRFIIIYSIQNLILFPLYVAGAIFIAYTFNHISLNYSFLTICLTIPFIIYSLVLYTRYFFATYITLDKNKSVKESLVISKELSKKSMKSIFNIIFWTQLLAMVLSQITLGLASFVLIPVLSILYAYVYKPLETKQPNEETHGS